MKMFRRLAAMAVAVAMVVVMLPAAVSAAVLPEDVKGTKYEDAATLLSALEIMVGDGAKFNPDNNVTRAEFARILVAVMGQNDSASAYTPKGIFADVATNEWYAPFVEYAAQFGAINGYGNGNFGPNDLITRQDMALMTYKTAKIMNKSLEPVNAEITFEDSHEISDYAFEAVMTLQKAGIINGMTDTTFEPHSNATRAQSAKVIFDTFVDAQ